MRFAYLIPGYHVVIKTPTMGSWYGIVQSVDNRAVYVHRWMRKSKTWTKNPVRIDQGSTYIVRVADMRDKVNYEVEGQPR